MNTTDHSRGADTPSPPLQRGKACLSCRRRKMRCDGARPTCTQCIRGDRAIDCEYTDGNRRPRTIALEEDIARLQARVQELENPDSTTPSLTLHDPYEQRLRSPTPHHTSSTSADLLLSTHEFAGPSSYHGYGFDQGSRVPQEETALGLQRAIDIISPYALDFGVFLSLARLRAHPTNIIPALRSTIALCSSHLTQASAVSQQVSPSEPALLSRVLHSLTEGLSTAHPRLGPHFYMQILQAQVLLAYYLHRVCQITVAQSQANGAIALAVGLGLHMRSGDVPTAGLFNFIASSHPRLPRPSDAVEEKERVDAWWTIYLLVKFLEMIHPGPPVVTTAVKITVAWPGSGRGNDDQSNFEQTGQNGTRGDTIALFLATPNFTPSLGTGLGLQARAGALLGEAQSLIASYIRDPSISQTADFRNRFCSLDSTTQNVFAGLPHPATLSTSAGTGNQYSVRQLLLTVNLIALAQITLHRPFVSSSASSHRRCIDSALRAAQGLNGLGDLVIVNPVCTASWGALFFVLHDELVRLRVQRSRGNPNYNPGLPHSASFPPAQGSDQGGEANIIHALQKLVSVFRTLPGQYPLQASLRAKFEAAVSSI
ncbi:hypothetical protein J3A83DRAFT_4372371 [Scleroderma citrinum]